MDKASKIENRAINLAIVAVLIGAIRAISLEKSLVLSDPVVLSAFVVFLLCSLVLWCFTVTDAWQKMSDDLDNK